MYFLFCFLLLLAFQPAPITAVDITSQDYNTFGWKPLPEPSKNVTLAFDAHATTDIHCAIQYAPNQFIEIVINGWNNLQSAVRNYTNGSLSSEILIPSATRILPVQSTTPTDPTYFSSIVITIMSGGSVQVTVNGVSIFSQVFTFVADKEFTAYSFKAFSVYSWTERNNRVLVPAAPVPIAVEKLLTTGNFSNYGWKALPTASNYIEITFNAQATQDIHVGFQYAADKCILVAIGGWNNTKGCIRNNSILTEQTFNEINIVSMIIPNQSTYVAYSIKIEPTTATSSTITVKANGIVICSYTDTYLVQNFTNYSFRSWPPATVKLSDEKVITTAPFFTGYTVPSGTYWLTQPNNVNSFLASNGGSWGTTKEPFIIGRNASNLSFNAINYGTNNGSLPFSISNFIFVPVTPVVVEKIITSNTYNEWIPITPAGNKITLNFNAVTPKGNLYVAFQYATNQYIQVIIGSSGNTQSYIRNIVNGIIVNEKIITPSVIPSLTTSVAYIVSITPSTTTTGLSTITVSANGSQIISYTDAYLSQQYSAYGFIAFNTECWKILTSSISVNSESTSILSQANLTTLINNVNTAMTGLSGQATSPLQTIITARSDFRTVADRMKITIKFPWEA